MFEFLFTVIILVLLSTGVYTVLEWKLIGSFQRRVGPDVVGLEGILQFLVDGVKIFTKEFRVNNIGYYLNLEGRQSRKVISFRTTIDPSEKANGTDIYESNRIIEVKKDELKRGTKLWKKSKDPLKTGIINPYLNSQVSDNYHEVK